MGLCGCVIGVFINHISYGQSRFNLTNITETERLGTFTGYSRYHGQDVTLGVRGLFSYYMDHFFIQSDVDYFYVRFMQPDYIVAYPQAEIIVPKLVTNVGTYVENAKITYFIDDYFAPFITGSLLQVASRSFSRTVLSPASAASPLPD